MTMNKAILQETNSEDYNLAMNEVASWDKNSEDYNLAMPIKISGRVKPRKNDNKQFFISDFEDNVIEQILIDSFNETIKTELSPLERRVVLGLHYFENSASEIARELKMTYAQIKAIEKKALRKLRHPKICLKYITLWDSQR